MIQKRNEAGFGLIEIMVGVVISIIASIVMFQTYSVSERQKRTTTGAADAQGNGAIALVMMERDVKMAGWGQNIDGDFVDECTTIYSYRDGAPVPELVTGLFASVVVTDGGTAGPDSITVQYYGNPSQQQIPSNVGPTTIREDMPQSSSELKVTNTNFCHVDTDGDGVWNPAKDSPLAVVSQNGRCTLMQITMVSDSALHLQHNPGGGDSYNPTIQYQKDNGWPKYTRGAKIHCFATPTLYQRTYRIDSNQLVLDERNNAGAVQTFQISPDIVDMQIQYGIANLATSQKVDQWVAATGAWVNPSATDRKRIRAVRVALAARSATYEKPDETGTCTTTTTTMAETWSNWAAFNTGTYQSDWGCYRYKPFEAAIPLRNIIWAKPWD